MISYKLQVISYAVAKRWQASAGYEFQDAIKKLVE